MDVHPIRTDEDHRAALAAIGASWGAPDGSPEGDKLDVLVALVDRYEARRWPIESGARFDPVDVPDHAIEEFGHSQAELAELLGCSRARRKSRAPARAHGRHDSPDQRGVEASA